MAGANRIYADLNDELFDRIRKICFDNKISHKTLCERALEYYLKEGKQIEKIKGK